MVEENNYSQLLDYVNLPFCCFRFHLYGHLFSDCKKLLVKRVGRKNIVQEIVYPLGQSMFVEVEVAVLKDLHEVSLGTSPLKDECEKPISNTTLHIGNNCIPLILGNRPPLGTL